MDTAAYPNSSICTHRFLDAGYSVHYGIPDGSVVLTAPGFSHVCSIVSSVSDTRPLCIGARPTIDITNHA